MKNVLKELFSEEEMKRMECPNYSGVVYVAPSEMMDLIIRLIYHFDTESDCGRIQLPCGGSLLVQSFAGGEKRVMGNMAGMGLTTIMISKSAFYDGKTHWMHPSSSVIAYLMSRLRTESKHHPKMVIV